MKVDQGLPARRVLFLCHPHRSLAFPFRRVRLSKRRAKAGVQSGTNAVLVVKHRDMNEKELEAQVGLEWEPHWMAETDSRPGPWESRRRRRESESPPLSLWKCEDSLDEILPAVVDVATMSSE